MSFVARRSSCRRYGLVDVFSKWLGQILQKAVWVGEFEGIVEYVSVLVQVLWITEEPLELLLLFFIDMLPAESA